MNRSKHTSFQSQTILNLIFIFMVFWCHSLNAQFGDSKLILPDFKDAVFDLGDFDGDGDLDVIVAGTDYNRSLVWFENVDVIGTEWEPHPIAQNELGNIFRKVIVVDFDNDGDLDFLILKNYSDKLYLFRNTGLSNENIFSQELIHESIDIRFLEIAEFDNDANTVEILVGNGGIFVLLTSNSSTNNITTDTLNTPNNANGIYSYNDSKIQIIDLDNDGDQDIVYSVREEYYSGQDPPYFAEFILKITWLENTNGDLNFENFHTLVFQGELGWAQYEPGFVVGNFNGDDLPDLIYTKNDNQLTILSQNQDHTFSEYDFGLTVSTDAVDIVSADFDLDGDLDFATGNPDTLKFWYQNDGNGVFSQHIVNNYDNLKRMSSIKKGDVDGDGFEDLFYMNSKYQEATEYQLADNYNTIGLYFNRNNGDLNFSNSTLVTDNIRGSKNIYPLDVDNDGDEDLVFSASGEGQIYWVENKANGNLSEPKVLISDSDIVKIFPPVDIDNDGDLDLLANTLDYQLVWYESVDGNLFNSERITTGQIANVRLIPGDFDNDGDIDFVPVSVPTMIHENNGDGIFSNYILDIENFHRCIGISDLTNDGIPDLLFTSNGNPSEINVAIQDINGNFVAEELINFQGQSVSKILLDDLDCDGDDDIIVQFSFDFNLDRREIVTYFNDQGTFNKVVVGHNGSSLSTIEDLDGDGRKDLVCGFSWNRQLYSPFIFSSTLPYNVPNYFNFSENLVDLDFDGDLDLYIQSGHDGLVWAENQINDGYWLTGNVFWDENQTCELDGIDTLMNLQVILEFENGTDTYYASTNASGAYTILLPENGEYNISITPPTTYWESCVNNTSIQVDSTDMLFDIPMLNIIDCPLMGINVGSGPFRPCIDGHVYLNYYNNGTVTAENVQIEVVLDENLIINSITPPYSSMTDSSYLFDVGSVGYADEGTIYFDVTPDCDSIFGGEMICVNAYVTPDSICADNLWDGSVISANGNCTADSVYFRLENIGQGDMLAARNYYVNIINDDIVMLINLDTFQLESGESKEISISSQNNAIQLLAEQHPNIPNGDDVSILVTECAGLPVNEIQNLIMNFPDDDGDSFSEYYCRQVTGAYDPNSKEAIPAGYGAENLIDREWEINYTINFQNVGNDTAFTVVVVDTLTEYVDISTIKIQGGSHAFDWSIEDNRNLVFVFPNILLPDSLTNERGSQGHVNFSIMPNADVAFGTQIVNEASIYFDFNEPIVTNESVHTIRTPIFASSIHLDVCEGGLFDEFTVLNDTLVIDSLLLADGLHLTFQHVDMIENLVEEIDTIMVIGESLFDMVIQADTTIIATNFDEYNCEYTTIYHVFATTTNIEDINSNNQFTVFPNPVKDQLTITWDNPEHTPSTIELFDINGMQQHFQNAEIINSGQQVILNVSNLKTGIVMLRIRNEYGSSYLKIMVIE